MSDVKELLPRVKEMLVERLFLDVTPDQIGDGDNLIERFAIDSVRIFEVVVGLEENFGVNVAEEEFEVDKFSTPLKIAELIASLDG